MLILPLHLYTPRSRSKCLLTIGNVIVFIECGMVNCPLGSSRTNLPSIVFSSPSCKTNRRPYDMSSLSVGLLYIAPFIGGVLGSSIAGKCSDIVCRWMTRRNGGVFEPEFRLVMVALVALSTVLGLWGFGWSAQVEDPWIAPTVFFGVIGTFPYNPNSKEIFSQLFLYLRIACYSSSLCCSRHGS